MGSVGPRADHGGFAAASYGSPAGGTEIAHSLQSRCRKKCSVCETDRLGIKKLGGVHQTQGGQKWKLWGPEHTLHTDRRGDQSSKCLRGRSRWHRLSLRPLSQRGWGASISPLRSSLCQRRQRQKLTEFSH